MVVAPATTQEEMVPSNNPRMAALLEDTQYKGYLKRVPPAHQANNTGEPWQLWVETPDHKWLTRTYGSYADIWPVFVRQHRAGNDVTITSRRIFYAPPGEWYRVKVRKDRIVPGQPTHRIETRWRQTFFWEGADLHWCGRCRRPVYWMPLFSNHHALRRLPAVSDEDNMRCIICGIRWIATPDISQMTKLEVKP